MTSKTLIAAAASGLLLTGCAYPWLSLETRGGCIGKHCEVDVSAKWHDRQADGCFVDDVSPYTLHVDHARPMNVEWRLDEASLAKGFRFADNGIVFDDPAGWKECQSQEKNERFRCVNSASKGWHKYTVRLVNAATKCEPKDPWIVNN